MKSLFLCRISEDMYDSSKILVDDSGCGCCSKTIAGCYLNEDGNTEYEVDVAKLIAERDKCLQAIDILNKLIAEYKGE